MAKVDNRCPECGVFVKQENLPSHLRKAHAKGEEAARLERQSPSARRRGGTRAFPIWTVVIVAVVGVVVLGAVIAYSFAPPPDTTTPVTQMCVQHQGLGVHWHAQLSITILGSPFTIPANIGIVSSTCYRPLHTHETNGVVHIELPAARTVTLRDFFAIWGQPFSQSQILTSVADATHEIVMFVNGVPSGAYANLVLVDAQTASIEYRTL